MIVADKFRPGMRRQLERFATARAAGMPRRGWKVAINVPEVLKHLELPHSGVGWLDGHQVLASGDSFSAPPDATLLIEPEVAIHIGTTVARDLDPDRARACIAGVSPALEIVNYSDASASFDDVVAGCMFHAATVVAEPRSIDLARDLGGRWPVLRAGDRHAEETRDDLVPSDLGELVTFVSAFLAEFGEDLEAGDMILSGSYAAQALAIEPGQEAIADHGPLDRVAVRIRD
jgi:2-keto-4-pentenoate hydratase